MYNLGGESKTLKRSSAGSAFVQDLGEAVATAFGARYRPEIAKAVKSYARSTADGLSIDIAVDLDSSKIAIEPIYPGYASATHPSVVSGHRGCSAADEPAIYSVSCAHTSVRECADRVFLIVMACLPSSSEAGVVALFSPYSSCCGAAARACLCARGSAGGRRL